MFQGMNTDEAEEQTSAVRAPKPLTPGPPRHLHAESNFLSVGGFGCPFCTRITFTRSIL